MTSCSVKAWPPQPTNRRRAADESLETLAHEHPADSCSAWPRLHHSQRRQRLRRHLHLRHRRRPVWLRPAVDHDPHGDHARLRAGDLRAHGRRHRQRPQRAHPRRVWPAHHGHADVRTRSLQPRRCRQRVRRRQLQCRTLSHQQVDLGSSRRRARLGAGRLRRLQEARKTLRRPQFSLYRLHHHRSARASQLELGGQRHAAPSTSARPPQFRLSLSFRRPHRCNRRSRGSSSICRPRS